ncbi:hypothetical protein Fcan01_22575 [Folsomia candida]|uniref:Uncharacterized protein n=1 Tax=Folsomia candida TaxID=158441 RepID=A0A226DCM9_FOLCA|nr:hypothetical protein Fcan01_22575 [Folsomia candida]
MSLHLPRFCEFSPKIAGTFSSRNNASLKGSLEWNEPWEQQRTVRSHFVLPVGSLKGSAFPHLRNTGSLSLPSVSSRLWPSLAQGKKESHHRLRKSLQNKIKKKAKDGEQVAEEARCPTNQERNQYDEDATAINTTGKG